MKSFIYTTSQEVVKMVIINYHIKQYRLAMGISQRQLARLSGVGQATISRMERQQGDVSLISICQIAKALKVPVYKLFDY